MIQRTIALLLITTVTATSQLNVNVTQVKSGDFVHVSWQNLFTPSQLAAITPHSTKWVDSECTITGGNGDGSYWVGSFSPAISSLDGVTMSGDPARGGGSSVTEGTPPYTTPAPVKFISGTQLNKGYFDFKVTNHRDSINYVLFEGSLINASNFKAVALSPTITFTDRDAPSHGRLARTSSVDEMRVSWTSTEGTCTDCLVQWGLTSEKLDRNSVTPTSATYGSNDLCGRPANSSGFMKPGDLFSVVLDLSQESTDSRLAGLIYYYRFGSDTQGWSAVKSFLAPKPENPHVAMNIMVTADMGETYEDGSQYHWEEPSAVNTTLQMIKIGQSGSKNGKIDVVMHPGDLAYATGYESEWGK